ncbi:apolipoprotein N-acyltransferase [Rhodobacterales bacterium]|nr:apolipoprotein N-acyltransferase [Rhodobacterales bacterium]
MCVLAGGVTALSLPPYDLSFLLPLTFSSLVWLLDGALEPGEGRRMARLRTGFSLGWLFGFGYFLAGLWWIGSAFLVEADRYAWMMPFAVFAMPVGLALFTGLGTALAALVWNDRSQRILFLAAGLTLSDWLRGHVLTGFPWNAFGYGVSQSLVLSQVASLVGIYGLSFLVVAISSAPATLADSRPLSKRLVPVTSAIAVLVAVAVFGAVRLSSNETQYEDLDIRIVQPSIDQQDKWRPELKDEIFQTYLDMTEVPLGGSARVGNDRLVVWPESAVPFLLTLEPGALFRIGQALGENAELVTGANRGEAGANGPNYFNSVYMVENDGTVSAIYDKVRLVPFGEYLPLQSLLEQTGLSSLAGPFQGFTPGYRKKALTTAGGIKFQPLVCYEAIFPGSTLTGKDRPSFLLNVSNDAWFGRTPGPYQHLAQARMRAIETGLPMVRAANTGISAIIDGKGEVIEKMRVFRRGVIDGKLPARLDTTFYGRFGDVPLLIIWVALVIFTGMSGYNRYSPLN